MHPVGKQESSVYFFCDGCCWVVVRQFFTKKLLNIASDSVLDCIRLSILEYWNIKDVSFVVYHILLVEDCGVCFMRQRPMNGAKCAFSIKYEITVILLSKSRACVKSVSIAAGEGLLGRWMIKDKSI